MKTMICLILDRTGSMQGKESDVVGGVNAFLEDQKKDPSPASIAFVRFDSEAIERFRPMQDLREVKPLDMSEYRPRASTPLLDAVGRTIVQLDEDWKAEKPDRCIVLIATDGQENASTEYSKEQVKALIEARQNSGMWAFIYLGANVDSFAEAGALGVWASNTANFVPSGKGVRASYTAASASVRGIRATGSVMADNLGGDIGEDGSVSKPAQAGASAGAAQSEVTATWAPPQVPAASIGGGSSNKPAGTWAPPA